MTRRVMANMTLSAQPERTDAHAGQWRVPKGCGLWRLTLAQGANRELSVERGFWSGLAVEALRVGELFTAKVHRYAGKRG